MSELLVTQSSDPGGVVIDPFIGVGSVGCAAVKHERHFWGNDVEAEAVSITRNRLLELGAIEEHWQRQFQGRR